MINKNNIKKFKDKINVENSCRINKDYAITYKIVIPKEKNSISVYICDKHIVSYAL
jgi:hypothetical protein